MTLLCATSVSSVSPWFNFPKKNNHRDTEDAEVAQRSSSFKSFFSGKAALDPLKLTKLLDQSTIRTEIPQVFGHSAT